MITKDEEGFLRDCLLSVQDYVDEIVIVDTGSSDNTLKIAEEFGAKIYHFTWCDDFAAARNESIKHATGDWILVLDADEVIAEKDLVKIKELIKTDAFAGYLIDQRNYTSNNTYSGWQACDNYKECRGDGFFVSKIVRLFRRSEGIKFRNKVHEAIDLSIIEKGGKIGEGGITIHHYGYLKGEEVINEKRKKYLGLGLQQIALTPNDPRPYYEAAQIYQQTDNLQKAAEFFEKVTKLKPGYKLAYTNLADIYTKLGEEDKAIQYYQKAIADQPSNEHAYINLAMLYQKIKKPQHSLDLLQKVLHINPKSVSGYHHLATLLIRYKRFKEALQVLERGYKETGIKKFEAAAAAVRRKIL